MVPSKSPNTYGSIIPTFNIRNKKDFIHDTKQAIAYYGAVIATFFNSRLNYHVDLVFEHAEDLPIAKIFGSGQPARCAQADLG